MLELFRSFFNTDLYTAPSELLESYLKTIRFSSPEPLPEQYEHLMREEFLKAEIPDEFLK